MLSDIKSNAIMVNVAASNEEKIKKMKKPIYNFLKEVKRLRLTVLKFIDILIYKWRHNTMHNGTRHNDTRHEN